MSNFVRLLIVFFSFILFPLLCGVDVRLHTPPCSTVVHIISRQSLIFDIVLHFVQPSSLRSSSLPCPPCCDVTIKLSDMSSPCVFRIQFLRHLRDFFQVMFKLDIIPAAEEGEDEGLRMGGDKVALTCVGAGFRNLSKPIL